MNIVMLDRNSLGMDVDISVFHKFGNFTAYDVQNREESKVAIKDAEVLIFNKTKVDEDLLQHAPNMQLLCVTATGWDNIDVPYATSRGIQVRNVRNYSTPAVCQHTFALALYLLEKLNFYDEYVKSGAYSKQLGFSNFSEAYHELSGKTWGIIGMGNIGKAVAKVAEAFGCRVIHFSPSGNTQPGDYEKVSFGEILQQSDILSIHCPLTDKTRNLINKEALSQMKQTAILVNVSRGPVVNDADLAAALNQNLIGAAGLDVLGVEPMAEDNPLGLIKDSRKLLITPHMAWASVEARNRCIQEVALNIEAFEQKIERNLVTE